MGYESFKITKLCMNCGKQKHKCVCKGEGVGKN